MITGAARIFLIAASAAALALGGLGMVEPLAPVNLPEARQGIPAARAGVMRPQSLDSLVRSVAALAPFRARRRPARVAFDSKPAIQPSDEPATPKPVLLISGIVWGAEPSAVIQGLPGAPDGRVLRRGDVFGGIRVTRIERNRVWLAGLDTSWALALKEPWK